MTTPHTTLFHADAASRRRESPRVLGHADGDSVGLQPAAGLPQLGGDLREFDRLDAQAQTLLVGHAIT
jgi:hypothetical protein